MYLIKQIISCWLFWSLIYSLSPTSTYANNILDTAPNVIPFTIQPVFHADNDEHPLQIALIGVVRQESNKRPVWGANVKLLIGDTGESVDFTTDKDGSFHFRLQPNTSYEIHVMAENGQVNRSKKITTEHLVKSTILHAFIEIP